MSGVWHFDKGITKILPSLWQGLRMGLSSPNGEKSFPS